MKPVSPCKLVDVGVALIRLRRITKSWTVHKFEDELGTLQSLLNEGGFTNVSAYLTSRIEDRLAELKERDVEAGGVRLKISSEDAKLIQDILDQIDLEMGFECRSYQLFRPEIGFDELKKLTDESGFSENFDPEVLQWVPPIAEKDFREAARCLAFGVPNAAASLALRATEACLGMFYRYVFRKEPFDIKKKRDDADNPTFRTEPWTWGKIIWKIDEDWREREGNRLLYEELKRLGRYFRNPTQHPQMRYNQKKAARVWKLCIDSVNDMFEYVQTSDQKLAVLIPWPCDLDTVLATYLINKFAGGIGQINVTDQDALQDDENAGYVINLSNGQFDGNRSPWKPACRLIAEHLGIDDEPRVSSLLRYLETCPGSDEIDSSRDGLFRSYANKLTSNSASPADDLLHNLWRLVDKFYDGGHDLANSEVLKMFVKELGLPPVYDPEFELHADTATQAAELVE